MTHVNEEGMSSGFSPKWLNGQSSKNLDGTIMVRVLTTIIDKHGGYKGSNVKDHEKGDDQVVLSLSSSRLEEPNLLL